MPCRRTARPSVDDMQDVVGDLSELTVMGDDDKADRALSSSGSCTRGIVGGLPAASPHDRRSGAERRQRESHQSCGLAGSARLVIAAFSPAAADSQPLIAFVYCLLIASDSDWKRVHPGVSR